MLTVYKQHVATVLSIYKRHIVTDLPIFLLNLPLGWEIFYQIDL